MSDQNLYTALMHAINTTPDAILLRTLDGKTVSYADAHQQSARVANYLTGLGLQPGDRVSVQVEKSPASLWLYLGVLRAGLVYHPLNTAYALDEMRYFLGNAEPGLLVCDPQRVADYEPLCREFKIAHLNTLDDAGQGSLSDAVAVCDDTFDTVTRTGDDLAALLYSSGTTGRPKGIMLSHQNLRANAESLVALWGFSSNDVLLHVLPIYHVHGLFVAVHCALMSGASMHWLSRLDVKAIRALLPQSTVMMGVPTYYTRLLADPEFGHDDCVNMRLFISGSAPLLEETFNDFARRTGHTILERYGMTETGMNTSNPLDGERRAGTVGLPIPGVEVRVRDTANQPLADGTIGELQVRGPNVFKGYWRMPEKTAADFTDDGWFITGDQARIEHDGYVSIVGRSKDMVISGGLNVYPKEVEALINDLPGVQESAVFGVPHPDFGEAVVATIVRDGSTLISEEDVLLALENKLARFKQPKKIQFADALPRNAMGKVQKNKLRDSWDAPF